MADFISPVTWEYKVSSVLGDPRSYGEHEGIDLVPKTASSILPVVAAAAGKVIESGYMADGYGYWVKLQHADGYQTIYGHFSGDPLVKKGDVVVGGQVIGNAGNSGNSTGIHLHYSIIHDGTYLDPAGFLSKLSKKIDEIPNIIDTLEWKSFWQYLFSMGISGTDDLGCGSYPGGDISDEAIDWADCVRSKVPADKLSGLEPLLQNLLNWTSKYDKPNSSSDPFGIVGVIDESLAKIMLTSLNAFTWPMRIYVNGLSLSEKPLNDGLETMVWLREPEHQRIYMASIIAVIIAVIFILLALVSFLKDPALEIAGAVANPAGAVVGTVKK